MEFVALAEFQRLLDDGLLVVAPATAERDRGRDNDRIRPRRRAFPL